MYNGVIRALQRPRPRRRLGQHPHSALCDERDLSAGRRRVRRLLPGKTRGADGRGRPARLHRAGAAHDAAQRGYSDEDLRQGRVADGRRIYRRRDGGAAFAHSSPSAVPDVLPDHIRAPNDPSILSHDKIKALADVVPARPPGFCTGCPERPIFAAMKLVEKELGTAPHRRRYRLPSVLDPAAVQHRRDDDGLWPRPGLGFRLQRDGGQALDLDHGRRRFLAQRPDQRHRQCRLQPARRRHPRRRQSLSVGNRRPGHPVVARRQQIALDQASDHRSGEGHRRQLGAPDRPHL